MNSRAADFHHITMPILKTAPRFSITRLMLVLGLGIAALAMRLHGQDAPAPTVDPRIAGALTEISSARIQSNIEKLVSFGTRSTLSAQDPASISSSHGIGAAREWIRSQFEQYSKDCGHCLDVKTDAFMEAPADRIPQPTQITNVYAVLKGTDSESAKRIVLVSGHYDSRNSDTFDVKGDAPGANDDASGTAVSLECARVLSKLKFPATVIFLTVAGEEQGLNGSAHFAKMAKEQRKDRHEGPGKHLNTEMGRLARSQRLRGNLARHQRPGLGAHAEPRQRHSGNLEALKR
jgi:Peptidase family M28